MGRKPEPSAASRKTYVERINRVLDHIDLNLGRELTLESLADVAAFSKYHFHRIFSSVVGETLAGYISRQRLRKAAYELLTRPEASVTETAADCGFADPAVFAKSFRRCFGMSATEWRAIHAEDGGYRQERVARDDDLVEGAGDGGFGTENVRVEYLADRQVWTVGEGTDARRVEVRDFPETTLAYVRYFGPYRDDEALFRRLFRKLFDWAGPRRLVSQDSTKAVVVYHEYPGITPDDRLRISVCCTVPEGTAGEGEVGVMRFSPGTCAAAGFHCGAGGYREAWDWMYRSWLPSSGFAPSDGPAFELYPWNSYDPATGKSAVDICVPVRPL